MQFRNTTRFLSVALSLAISLTGGLSSKAAPGDLDSRFSGDGKLTDGLSYGSDTAFAVAIQPDGRIIVAGSGSPTPLFGITRYNPDGSLDTSFGNGGKVTTEVGSPQCVARSVALQPDGKIVVAGWSYIASGPKFAIARYNSDGSLDSSFSGVGWVTTSFGDGESGAVSVVVQQDGKIVAAGYALDPVSGRTFALTRHNPDGSLDNSFDGDGKVRTDFLAGFPEQALSVALQADGRIVAAGLAFPTYDPSGHSDFALARYNVDGSLDTSFDVDGKVLTPIGPADDYARSIAIQPDGKMVVAGSSTDGPVGYNYDFALVRYNTNGSLDTTFNGDGKVTTAIGSSQDSAWAVALQTDGKIVVSGESIDGQFYYAFATVRYNSNGSLDLTFDGDGKAITSVGPSTDSAYSSAIQPDGKIVVAGSAINIIDDDFGLVRYNADGSLDMTFDSDGMATTDFGVLSNNRLHAVGIQSDGKILVAGSSSVSFVVARYLPDGSVDTTFGGTGKVLVPLSYYFAFAVVIQADGKIVVAGGEYDSNGVAIVRLNSNGSLDTTFNEDGVVTENLAGGYGLAIQTDGKILALGNTFADESVVVRYNSDGSPDNSFGTGGRVSLPTGPADIIVQPDGKIVVAGWAFGAGLDFAVVRLNTNGSLDTTFDSDGTVITSIGIDDYAQSVTMQPDGKLVVAGSTYDGSNEDFALVRYNPDGSLDATFDTDGKVVTSISTSDWGTSVAVQGEGKILVAGSSGNGLVHDFTLIQYNPDGSLDTTFGGGDGITTVDFDNSNDFGLDMALDNRGRAVVVGASDGAFAIARFLLGPSRTRFDFDGDGRSDVSVFRPSDRVWYLNRSTDGFRAIQFGLPTDKITPADFDGDGKTDIAIFRDGIWWMIRSSDGIVSALQFGLPGDVPVPGDYSGDGRDEIAVYRNGDWLSVDLSNGQSSVVHFGLANDKPVAADYDGDGRVDQATYRNGEWHLNRSSQGYTVVRFGLATDRAVVGDYDSDGRADLAVYRDGTWYLQQSTAGFTVFHWGLPTDIPTPADFDGDGKTDVAVYRNGVWYLNQSTGGISIQQFGIAGDTPIESALIP